MATGDGTISLAIAADLHCWLGGLHCATADGSLQLIGATEQLVSALLDTVRAGGVETLLLLGDLVCGGGSYQMPLDAFLQTHAFVHECIATAGIATHVLPGNHDSRPGTGGFDEFTSIWSTQAGIGQTIELPHVRCVLLNAQGHDPEQIAAAEEGDPVYGWVSVAEMRRLEHALSTADERPVILLTHQLLRPWAGAPGWREYYAIKNAEPVLEVIAAYGNVRAVVQAHAHRLDLQYLSLGGLDCAFLVLPAIVEFPVAWVRLDIARDYARFRMQPLPLPDLRALAQRSGQGQDWRAGRPQWWDFALALT